MTYIQPASLLIGMIAFTEVHIFATGRECTKGVKGHRGSGYINMQSLPAEETLVNSPYTQQIGVHFAPLSDTFFPDFQTTLFHC